MTPDRDVELSPSRLRALYTLSVGLVTTHSAEQVVARSIEVLTAELQCTAAWAVEVDRTAERLVPFDDQNAGGGPVAPLMRTAPAAEEILRAVLAGRLVWAANPDQLKSALPTAAEELKNLDALVLVPLRATGDPNVIGALGLQFDRPRTPEPDEVPFLVAAGELVGQSLARSRLRHSGAAAWRAASAAADRAERMGALAAALVSAQHPTDVTSVLAAHMHQALDCQTFSLRSVDLENKVSRALSMGGDPIGYRDRFTEVALDMPSALREVAETKRPVFLGSADENRRRYGVSSVEHYERARIEALTRLPLLVDGELVAVLSIGYWAARAFDEPERLFLTTVADLAAQALGRALRTERLRQEADRAQRLHGLAAALVDAHTSAEVSAVLGEHVRRATACDLTSLREVDLDAGLARMVHQTGSAIDQQERLDEVGLDFPSALAEVVATQGAVYLSGADEIRARYGVAAAGHYEANRVESIARLPLIVDDELIAILTVAYWAPRDFNHAERLFLGTVADLAAQALGRALRTEKLHEDARRHRLLSAAQAAINRRLNPTDQLRALARSVVPELADFSSVHVLATPAEPGVLPPLPVLTDRVASEVITGVEGAPVQRGIAWYDGDPITETIRHGSGLTDRIATPQIPEWSVRTGTADTFRTGLNHLVLAPVMVEGRIVAVASFGICNDRPPWTPADRDIIEEIARYAAVALEHGLSFQATRETALVLQQALLSAPPTVPGLELAGRYRPAGRDKIGGDWFDAFETSPGRVALAVGDVVGHDINAAAAMGQLRAALRVLALDERLDPGGVLQRLNDANATLHMTDYATAAFARLTRAERDWQLTWALAGHLPPVLIDPAGRARPLEATGGIALVPGPNLSYGFAHLDLAPGSTLLLYTDGLVERRGVAIDTSIDELCGRAADASDRPLEELCDHLLASAPHADDVALLAVRIDG